MRPPAGGKVDPGRRAFLRGQFLQGKGAGPVPTSGVAMIDRGSCMAWDGVICISCRMICDEQAIVVDHRQQPSIVDAACTGCGICIGPCPSRAIRIRC